MRYLCLVLYCRKIYICVNTYLFVGGKKMENITLSVPDTVHEDMKLFSEIRWSEVARKAIIEKVERLKLAEKLAQKSKLTKKDVEEFSNKIKKEATKRLMDEHNLRL